MKVFPLGFSLVVVASLEGAAFAQDQQAGGSVAADASGVTAAASAPSSDPDAVYDDPSSSWWLRHRPLPMAWEVGFFAGAAWINSRHNLQDMSRVTPTGGHRLFDTSPHWGIRGGFYPYRFAGIEAELGIIHTATQGDDATATILTPRGHVVFQLPYARLVPFVLAGGGFFAMTQSSMGKDTDPAIHFGGGVKLALTDRVTLRADIRNTLLQKNRLLPGVENGDVINNVEFLGGISMTFGRTESRPVPVDSDGDGVPDDVDRCPNEPANTADGCPLPPPADQDHDGIPDDQDRCPTEPEDGFPPEPKDGCPNKDLDRDGILVPDDKCPEVAGVAPDGCPPKDSDGDGIIDSEDKCPNQPETKNGFEDEDGCPDELPKEIAKFTGVIKGINFDFGKATLRPNSFPLLDDAVKVLTQYPKLRLRISGHTDNQGSKEVNQKLSEDRAAAVKTYLVEKGVEQARVETRGVGPDEPLEDNKTEAGRAKNRRIEFQVLP